MNLSTRIKTYTEQIEQESTLTSIRNAVRHAECIVFLGFAYHKQNMRLLFKEHVVPKRTKPVFGTALGMSDADKSEVTSILIDLFPEEDDAEEQRNTGPFEIRLPRMTAIKMNDHIHVENELTCAKFFDHYAKSLAG